MTPLRATVVPGKRMGGKLGFPTANLTPFPGQGEPPQGVYIGRIQIENIEETRICLINHGRQPTLPSGGVTIEVHILDFDEDIYGACVNLWFDRFLRHEQRFRSVPLLQRQLAIDVAAARAYAEGADADL